MYIVMTRSTKMPSKVKARYRKVAVVELMPGFENEPAMISERARGVKRIVKLWDHQNVGKNIRSAYAKAVAEAKAMAAQLNEGA